jgi:tetratricopeptide (TPR) repeat protein
MTKTTRNRLLILATASTLAVAGVGSAFYLHSRQAEQKLLDARAAGLLLFQQHKYADALPQLGKYIARHQSDPDALYAYATSRALTEEPDGRHVIEGMQLLRRYLDLAPDNAEARELLLDLYTRAGYSNEAVELADRVLSSRPDDTAALRARYIALGRLRRFDDAIKAVDTYLARNPADLAAHQFKLALLDVSKAPPEKFQAHADLVAKTLGPTDPRAMLVQAMTYATLQQIPPAIDTLRHATDAALIAAPSTRPAPGTGTAASDIPRGTFVLDADFVTRAADLYDGLELFSEGQRLVERAADAHASDSDLAYTVATRLWAANRFDAVIARTDSLSSSAPTRLLALRALSLFQVGKPDVASPLLDTLAARETDPLAVGWNIALRAAFLKPNATLLDRRTDYLSARSRILPARDPLAEAVILHLLAGVERDLGETELAISYWSAAHARLPQWTTPVQLLVQAYLDVDSPDQARQLGRELCLRSPTVPNVALAAEAWARYLSRNPDPADADRLLTFINDIHTQAPDDPRLAPALVLAHLARGDRAAAVSLLKPLLQNPKTPAPILARLAQIATTSPLGLEAEANVAFDRAHSASTDANSPAGSATGVTADYLLQTALRRASTGQADQALEQLKQLVSQHASSPDAPRWNLLLARYLDATNDPTALDALRQLADKNPDSLEIQQAIVSSRSAWADRTLIASSVEHLKALTGPDAVTWRVARARLLLLGDEKTGAVSDRDSAEAVSILSSVVSVAPRVIAPRLLLAKALQSVNAASSLEQLSVAADLDRQSPVIALELARMLIDQNRPGEARTAVLRIIKSPTLTLGQRVKFASLLARLGDSATAIEVLSRPTSSSSDSTALTGVNTQDLTARDTALARLLANDRRRQSEAAALFEKLLARSQSNGARPDISLATDAAEFYARCDDLPKARRTLDTALKDAPPDIADTALARLEENYGDRQLAIRLLQQVVDRARSAPTHSPSNNNAAAVATVAGTGGAGTGGAAAGGTTAGGATAGGAAGGGPGTPYVNLAMLLLRLGQYPDAARTIAEGASVAPADPALSTLARVGQDLTLLKDRPNLQFLVALISRDPLDPATTMTLDAIRGAAASDPAATSTSPSSSQLPPSTARPITPAYSLADDHTIAALREVIKQHPRFLPAHATLIEALLAAGRKRDAGDAAGRLFFGVLPTDPTAAQIAAATYLEAGDPQAALGVASRWRELTPDDPTPADLALASAYLSTGDPDRALTQIRPYIETRGATAAVPLNMLFLRCRALIALGRPDDAFAVANQLWSTSNRIRPRLLESLVSPSEDSTTLSSTSQFNALPILQRLSTQPQLSSTDHLLLANAFYELGSRTRDLATLGLATDQLTLVGPEHANSLQTFVLAAQIADARGDRAAAEKHYRSALTLAPDSEVVANNLADLLVRIGTPAATQEALTFARNATLRKPGVPQFHDTLARVYSRLGQTDAALSSFETALKLAPDRLDTLVAYASLLSSAGRTRDANDALRRIDSLLPTTPAGTYADLHDQIQSLRDSLKKASL